MKRFMLLMAGALLAACTSDDQWADFRPGTYEGRLAVTDNLVTPPVTTAEEGVRYILEEEEDGSYTLTMPGIRFVANMPPMTIQIPSLALRPGNGGGTLTSTVSPIVPYIGGTPYEMYRIPAFSGTVTARQLHVTFTCEADFNVGGPNGPRLRIDHDTEFRGERLDANSSF